MLSPADMLIIGAVALIAFGPDQLPKVARKAGQAMRDVQNQSQAFIREMERAADESEHRAAWEPPVVPSPPIRPYADVAHEAHAVDPAPAYGAPSISPSVAPKED